MGYLGPAVATQPVHVTSRRGAFRSTFTNGMLAAQWLRNVLMDDGVIAPGELIGKITDPADQAAIIEVAQNTFRLFANVMRAIPHEKAMKHAA